MLKRRRPLASQLNTEKHSMKTRNIVTPSVRGPTPHLVILELESERLCRSQGQDQVQRLPLAVRQVGGHLAVSLLVVQGFFGNLLPALFHRQADDVLPANRDQPLSLYTKNQGTLDHFGVELKIILQSISTIFGGGRSRSSLNTKNASNEVGKTY